MKLQFDKNQEYQLQAVQSIVNLFDGQPLNNSDFEFSNSGNNSGNKLFLTENELLKNLNKVQAENELRKDEISSKIKKLWYNEDSQFKEKEPEKLINTGFPNYSVEMETG